MLDDFSTPKIKHMLMVIIEKPNRLELKSYGSLTLMKLCIDWKNLYTNQTDTRLCVIVLFHAYNPFLLLRIYAQGLSD